MNRDLLKGVIETARANLEYSGSLLPVFFIGNEKTLNVVGAVFCNDREKDAASDAIRRMSKEIDADFVVFVTESWTIAPEHSEEFMLGIRNGKYKRVSDHPKRQEIVSFIIETRLSDCVGIAKIETRSDGSKTFGEVEMKEGENSGRFTHFLGPKAVRQ